MNRLPADFRLYLVTDRPLCLGRDLLDIVRRAVAGGAKMVQLREKSLSTREFVDLARAVKLILAGTGVPLIVNDRVDVALASEADGVHVGQSDMDVADVRALVGPKAIVGLSVERMDQVLEVRDLNVDYLGVGPVLPTATKADACPAWGFDGLARACAAAKLPVVAIGSMGAETAAKARMAGAKGVAVVSAICSASDPAKAAARILEAWSGPDLA
ncbi:MAG: thiamine phosphate synthase [Deltaproteobacteria bacterium]|nr:thiamine phosphate synthase [Deltaproteobacteria bacterium]